MRKDKSYCLPAMEIIEFENSPERIKQLILSAGSQIGSVHFIKRSTGELRKMAYRLHVTKPSFAAKPSGKGDNASIGTSARKDRDKDKDQITVLDVNKTIKDKEGKVVGRGAWRMIPLENVVQVTVKGTRYVIRK